MLRVMCNISPTGFRGWQVGEVYAPHALPMFREEQNSKKRKERSDRKDPVRSKKPDPPVSETPGGACLLLPPTTNVVLMHCLVRVWGNGFGLQGTGVCSNPPAVGLLLALAYATLRLL